MLGAAQVTAALETLNSRSPSAAEITSLQTNAPKIWDNLFQSTVYGETSSPASRDALKSSLASDKAKQTFFLALSDVLKIDEKNTPSTWDSQLKPRVHADFPTGPFGLNDLITMRDMCSEQLSSAWSLLHELLRIDLDPGHPLHSTVSSIVDKFMSRNIVSEVLKHLLETLREWQPAPIDRSVLTSFSAHEVSKYIQTVHLAWAVDFVEENCRCLDTLVLLSYSRQNLNLSELTELLTKFVTQPLSGRANTALQPLLEHAMRNDLTKIDEVLRKMDFRYVVLFSGCFQFWRLFQPSSEQQGEHPLLAPVSPDYSQTSNPSGGSSNRGVNNSSADSIFETLQSVTEVLHKAAVAYSAQGPSGRNFNGFESLRSTAAAVSTNSSGASATAFFLWKCFLQAFAGRTIVGAEFATTQDFQRFSELVDSFEIAEGLQKLVSEALSDASLALLAGADPSEAQLCMEAARLLPSDPNTFIYCSVLQELTNVLILTHTLRDESSLLDLGSVTSLVQATYRGQAELGGAFWSAWSDAQSGGTDHYYPLCRLVHVLLENTPHDPQYLWKILAALASSPESCMSILDMLNQPVHVIGFESLSQLQFRGSLTASSSAIFGSSFPNAASYDALQWDTSSTWLREHDGAIPPGTMTMKVSADTLNFATRGKGLWAANDTLGADSAKWYDFSKRVGGRGGANMPRFVPNDEPSAAASPALPAAGLCSPPDRAQGTVLDADISADRCLVRWDMQCLWWTLAFDALLRVASSSAAAATEDAELVQVLLKLLTALLKEQQQGVVVAYFLETKWNEAALLSLLQSCKCEQLYPMLSQNNLRIATLRADAAATYDLLVHQLGVSSTTAEQIVAKVGSPSVQESALYELSFANILSKVAATSLCNALRANRDAAQNQALLAALSLYVTIGNVSLEWERALHEQARSVFAQARGGNGVYEALHAVTSALPPSSPVLAQVYFLMSQHVIAQAGGKKAVTSANHLPLSVLFAALDARSAGSLAAEEVTQGLATRGCEIGEGELVLLLNQAGLGEREALDIHDFYRLVAGVDMREGDPETEDSGESKLGSSALVVEGVPERLKQFRQRIAQIAQDLSEDNGDADGPLKTSGIFLLNQFNQLFSSSGSVGTPEEASFLLLRTVHAIDALLGTNSTVAAYIVDSIANNVPFLESLLQVSVALGKLTTRSNRSNSSARPATFKDLLATVPTKATIAVDAYSVLPLNFSVYSGTSDPVLPPVLAEALFRISSVTMGIVSRLASAAFQHPRLAENLFALVTSQSPDGLTGLSWLTALVPTAAPNTAATGGASIGSYMCLLAGMLCVSAVAPRAPCEQLKLTVTRLLIQLVELMPSDPGSSNLADCIGTDNLAAVAAVLSEHMQSASEAIGTALSLRSVTLEFLLTVARIQPAALCLLIASRNTSAVANSGGSSHGPIADAILSVMANAESLYTEDPRALHILYEFLAVICKATDYHILVKTALFLIQSKKFWDHVTAPLMFDLPASPKLDSVISPFTAELFQPAPKSPLDILEGGVRRTGSLTGRVQDLASEVNLHAHRLHCHAAALTLLSIERYGVFYEIDVTVALATTKKLQAFYVKATESHRFISWIKHYLLISVDGVATAALEERAHELGFDLHELVTFSDLRPEARYGVDYKFDTAKLSISLENHLRLAKSKSLEIDALDCVDMFLLSRFTADIRRHNLSCVLSDAAMDLIRCWRQFLEFYVLPGSAAKQYQQKESARHSTDGGSGPRGRKHSFDGDDIDGTSGSPVIGTLSPITSAASNASPTASKKSAFSGDKRSYEVVTEVMTQLECHRADGCMNTVVGRFAVAEKCELLVSMIHHQLKVVAARTSDPSKSVIISRDLGSMRLTQDKMEKLLEKLDDLYRDLIFSATDSSEDLEGSLDDPQDLKNIVALRLLTSMMLLLNSIFAFNSADDAHSKLSQRRRSIYLYAVTALKNLTLSHGVAVFSNTSSLDISDLDNIRIDGAAEESKGLTAPSSVKDSSNRLSTEQAVAQVCLQIMKLAVPRSSGEPVISLTDIAAWRALLVESEAIMLLTQTVQALATATSMMPQWDANYAGWKAHELEIGVKGSAECSFPAHPSQTVNAGAYEETKCMLVSLLSALDAVLGGVSAKIITVQNTAPLNTLLQVVVNAPVFRVYQQVILAQPDHIGAVLMGYNSSTTEVSLIAACWIRVINLVEAVIVRFPESSAAQAVSIRPDGPVTVIQQDLSNTVCTFIRTYVDLLLLPMRPATHRYSVQQLSLMRAALNLFTAANTKLPIWKVQMPALHPEVSNRVHALMRGFSLLLWHGEDMETMEQQRRLLAHCVAVSSAEKREERAVHPRKIRKRSGSLGGGIGRSASVGGVTSPEPQHVHFGETTVLGAGMSIMKTSSEDGSGVSPSGGSIMKSKRAGSLRVNTGGDTSNDGILNTLVEFLLDIEAHMIAVMTPLATYLRHITPIPFEVSKYDDFGRPLFPLGNRVFYVSDRSECSLVEGFVYKLLGSGDRFDVMLLDDMIEPDVHTTQVRYTAAPIVQYQSLSDLAKHSVDDNTITIAYRHGHPEVSNSLSTAHLLRSLQLATSAVTGNRMQNQRMYPQAGQDLSVLAGQLAWLVVSNIAHHALAPMDREISMIHQLNDLKRAIRPRDHSSGLGSSSVASGSTSPFVSYLDHRDRLPMTPMAGTLTPTGSIGGSSGASTSAYLKWMHTAEWTNYVTFLDKWCEEIFYMLGRGATLVTTEQEEVEESPNARIRKKRIGLRARIEWVQSPEEV